MSARPRTRNKREHIGKCSRSVRRRLVRVVKIMWVNCRGNGTNNAEETVPRTRIGEMIVRRLEIETDRMNGDHVLMKGVVHRKRSKHGRARVRIPAVAVLIRGPRVIDSDFVTKDQTNVARVTSFRIIRAIISPGSRVHGLHRRQRPNEPTRRSAG